MSTNNRRGLRFVVISLLVFLAVQYEFGMAINLAGPPSISSFSFSIPGVLSALNQIGFVAVFHAALGTALTIISLVNLVLALASKIRGVQIFAGLGFLTMVLAVAMGLSFTVPAFRMTVTRTAWHPNSC